MRRIVAATIALALALGLTARTTPAVAGAAQASALSALRVEGNRVINAAGQPVILHGVNFAGLEYACIHDWGIFDSPDPFGPVEVAAMKSWGINAVRLPLNEDCWLGINGVLPQFGGPAYQTAVGRYVDLLNRQGLYAILDLHWSGPGTAKAIGLQPMPDVDHAPAFWTSVASTFKGNDAVIFDVFNEPHPAGDDSTPAWTCWRDGGTCAGVPFEAAGMQTLVSAIRATGATNIIALGGVGFAVIISQWLAYKPNDPLNNLVASWHSYNFAGCRSPSCWDSQVAPVTAQVPVLAAEIGAESCDATFVNELLNWLDAHQIGYLAWNWNTWSPCADLGLILDFAGTPSGYGQIYKDHLARTLPGGIALLPVAATNPLRTTQTLTAAVSTIGGQPSVGTIVTFTVATGPNAGKGTSATSDRAGLATFGYVGDRGPGVDTIEASYVDHSGTIQRSVSTDAWIDTVAPTLSLPRNLIVDATGPDGAIVTFVPGATDDSGQAPTVTCAPPSGNRFPIGTSTVTCTATDASANSATGSFAVVVIGACQQIESLADEVLTNPALAPPQVAALREKLLAKLAEGCARASVETKCRALERFASLVRTWKALGHLPASLADKLLVEIARIRNVLSCLPPVVREDDVN